jgi:hypothetical protein
MLIQTLMGQLILLSVDRGAWVRLALERGTGIMQRNPSITTREKFGAVSSLEDAVDMIDRARALALKYGVARQTQLAAGPERRTDQGVGRADCFWQSEVRKR